MWALLSLSGYYGAQNFKTSYTVMFEVMLALEALMYLVLAFEGYNAVMCFLFVMINFWVLSLTHKFQRVLRLLTPEEIALLRSGGAPAGRRFVRS